MAIIWITHDLGIVAGLVDRVQVMYAGYIVERAEVHELTRTRATPIRWACWARCRASMPRRATKLTPIEGLPPDLIGTCRRAARSMPRCRYHIDRCLDENPPLRAGGRRRPRDRLLGGCHHEEVPGR